MSDSGGGLQDILDGAITKTGNRPQASACARFAQVSCGHRWG